MNFFTHKDVYTMENKMKQHYEKYMYIIGILGSMVFFGQAYTIFCNKSAIDVSFFGFFSGFISVVSWLFYGFLIKNWPLIIANIIATIGALFVLLGIFLYS